jgi:YegS/Rv2252/BmrU family lipid kinase
MNNKTAFIINGNIKNAKKIISDIQSIFNSEEKEIFVSERVNHIMELTQKCCKEDFQNIIIGGGDGSLNEGLNGVMNANAFDKVNLGVFPLGSGNDFIKSVASPKSLSLLKTRIKNKSFKLIDIGLAKFVDENRSQTERYFINITDLGLGGVAVKKLQSKISFLSPAMNYNLAIGTTFLTYNKVSVACKSENFEYNGKIMSLVIANGQFFGSGMGIAPNASLEDGLFEIVVLGDINIFDYLKNLSKVKASQRIIHPEVSYHKTSRITIESLESVDLPIDMDGEFVGYSPIELVCLPKKIRFIV